MLCTFWEHAAYGILVPRPGTELAPTEVGAQSLKYCTAREEPQRPVFSGRTLQTVGARLLRPGNQLRGRAGTQAGSEKGPDLKQGERKRKC